MGMPAGDLPHFVKLRPRWNYVCRRIGNIQVIDCLIFQDFNDLEALPSGRSS